MHPVRQVRHGLPALRHSRQDLRSQHHQPHSRRLPDGGPQVARVLGAEIHAASCAGRLHGMRPVRRGLPGQEQERSQAPRHQHGAAAAAAREVQPVLGLLPEDPRVLAREALARPGERPATAAAAVRVLGRLRRLRRNSLHLADDPAVRRPRDYRATRPAARPSTAATCRRRPTA